MEEEKSFAGRIYKLVEQYAKTSLEIYKLKAIDLFAGFFATLVTGIVIWLIFLMLLLFLSIGAAFYLGHLLNAYHHGFFIVAGFYLLMGIVIYIYRAKCLKEVFNNLIIKMIFKDKEE